MAHVSAPNDPSAPRISARADDERVVCFREYLDAFNACDLHGVASFVTEDLVFDWGEVMPALLGRDAFVAFYTNAWRYFDEHITASDIRVEGDVLSAWISNSIRVHHDWPDCPIEPMRAGSAFTVAGQMDYQFDGRRICRITDVSTEDDVRGSVVP